jgi:hypothetical protein
MEIIIIVAYALLTAAALWFVGHQRSKQKKKTVYVCNLCNEHHCDCSPEKTS